MAGFFCVSSGWRDSKPAPARLKLRRRRTAPRAVGYWWAAGVFWAGAVIYGALIRGGTRLHHEAGQPEPLDRIVSALI
jgi:hypothetical protein